MTYLDSITGRSLATIEGAKVEDDATIADEATIEDAATIKDAATIASVPSATHVLRSFLSLT